VPGFIQYSLKTVTRVLQPALYGAGTRVKRLSDHIDGWAMSRQPVLNRSTHKFDKCVFGLGLPELFFKLWREKV
jgi:hypothetical protein